MGLKGKEIITAGSIIMPIDIKNEATTMSMMRKGRTIRKPISKAHRSSLIMNAGIRLCSGVSCGVAMGALRERSRKRFRSSSRKCCSMKLRSGPAGAQVKGFQFVDPLGDQRLHRLVVDRPQGRLYI